MEQAVHVREQKPTLDQKIKDWFIESCGPELYERMVTGIALYVLFVEPGPSKGRLGDTSFFFDEFQKAFKRHLTNKQRDAFAIEQGFLEGPKKVIQSGEEKELVYDFSAHKFLIRNKVGPKSIEAVALRNELVRTQERLRLIFSGIMSPHPLVNGVGVQCSKSTYQAWLDQFNESAAQLDDNSWSAFLEIMKGSFSGTAVLSLNEIDPDGVSHRQSYRLDFDAVRREFTLLASRF